MTSDPGYDRYATKRDRLARMTRLVSILQAHPDGIRTADIAERVGMSVRTVYRDLKAIELLEKGFAALPAVAAPPPVIASPVKDISALMPVTRAPAQREAPAEPLVKFSLPKK